MPKAVKLYVRYIDAASRAVGRFSMYGIFLAMMGVLLREAFARTLFNDPKIWTVEVAMFLMASYYLLGGGYSMILDSHVRMDLLYGRWNAKRKALADVITASFLIFYVVFLIIGNIDGIEYAWKYHQKNYTPWMPPLLPIKIVMIIGITLMLLECIATLFKDLAILRGKTIT